MIQATLLRAAAHARGVLCLSLLSTLAAPTAVSAGPGELTLQVIDRETREPLACRMHLINAAGKALKAPKAPFWIDHFVFNGEITLKLPKGEYSFEIERGPEYLNRGGRFSIEDNAKDTKVVDLKRFVNMAEEGWWSGDLDVRRPVKEIEELMLGDDLHVAEVVSWPDGLGLLPTKKVPPVPLVKFDKNRFYHMGAGRDVHGGGTLLMFNLPEPLEPKEFQPEYPPELFTLLRAKEISGAWVDAGKASSWDLPIWVASGKLDSVSIASASLARKTIAKSEAGGRPPDKALYPPPLGIGRWSEDIYHHLLNCGLRLPPTAGSESGEAASPVGYNRMYVHVDGELTYEKWWEGLRDGKVVITNGPMIRPEVEGQPPGYVFRAASGKEVELEIGLSLATRDPITYLEVMKNGEVVSSIRLEEWGENGGRLPPIKFKESGWFVIRAVTEVQQTYRFATTAPYYVEIDGKTRISKRSAQFFLDWTNARTKQLKLDDRKQKDAVLKTHRDAKAYWEKMVAEATAD